MFVPTRTDCISTSACRSGNHNIRRNTLRSRPTRADHVATGQGLVLNPRGARRASQPRRGGVREHCLSNTGGVASCAAPRRGEKRRGLRWFCVTGDRGSVSLDTCITNTATVANLNSSRQTVLAQVLRPGESRVTGSSIGVDSSYGCLNGVRISASRSAAPHRGGYHDNAMSHRDRCFQGTA